MDLKDVLAFVGRGAWNGLIKSMQGMRRWSFGERRHLRGSFGLTATLVGLLTALLSMALMVLAAGAYFLEDRGWLSRLTERELDVLTALTGVFAFSLLVFALLLLPAGSESRAVRRFFGWVAVLPIVAALVALFLFLVAVGLAWVWDVPLSPRVPFSGHGAFPYVVWGALVAAGFFVRSWLVQYIGDVAAYVASHRVDRFHALREEIKERVCEAVRTVYAARDPRTGRFLYRRVVVVAHSLGSVVAYDTLNALVLEERGSGSRLRVANRTPLFLTFGSPLDKMAFFFTAQARTTADTREELAGLVQPLVQGYRDRPLSWVNVHSTPMDALGGSLEYYDAPPTDPAYDPVKAVRNERDEDAVTPLAAHVQYWKSSRVWLHLGEALAPEPPETSPCPEEATPPGA